MSSRSQYQFFGFTYTLAGYVSVGINASKTSNTSASVSGDLIVGLVQFAPNKVPVSILAHVNGSGSVSKPTQSSIASFDFTVSSSIVLTSYISIVEKDASGNVVRTLNLKDLSYNADSGSDSSLHYITFNAANNILKQVLKSGEAVSLTFLISEILGTVTIGSVTTPVVTPKTLESIIQISGWSYASSTNYLTLVTGVGIGTSQSSGSGGVTLSSGNGDNQVYVDYADSADINGNSQSVTVNKSSSTDVSFICDDTGFTGYVSSVYRGSVSWNIVEIKFAPGASSIVYDPTAGIGQPLQNNANVILFSMLLFAIVLLFN